MNLALVLLILIPQQTAVVQTTANIEQIQSGTDNSFMAKELAALAFRISMMEVRTRGRQIVETELYNQIVDYIRIGQPSLCDPRSQVCRDAASRAMAQDVDRIVRDLPGRAERKLAMLLTTAPTEEFATIRATLTSNTTEQDRQNAAMYGSMLANAGIMAVIGEEIEPIRRRVELATAHLPRRGTIIVPRPPSQ